jgi:hypothetical protein
VLHHTRRSPDFMQKLLGYTQALFTHMAQCSACNRHHAAYFGECDRSFRRIVTGGLRGDFSAVSVT